MSLGHQRSRLISFRVSQDEYDNVRNACLLLGSRSVSDFARIAVMRAIGDSPRLMGPIPLRIAGVDPSMGNLSREVDRLARLVETLLRSNAKAAAEDNNAGALARSTTDEG